MLNCQAHDVPILVSARLLKPLGNPPPHSVKFFAASELLELVKDRVWLIACSAPGGWTTVLGPATITALILFVSGIPLLERKYEGNLEFKEYQRRTSAFFPLPPKP